MRTFLVLMPFLLLGCSLDADLEKLSAITDSLPSIDPNLKTQRTETDFVYGEIVTTGNGVVFKGSFGEISERQVLSSGVTIEGAFYE